MEDTTDDPMTPAEFRVVREYLGLTGDWLAAELGVAGRTVRAWEAGKWPIPDGVREHIEQLEAHAADTVGEIIDHYTDDVGDPTEVPLVTYRTDDECTHTGRPASWWRAVAARVAQEVPGLTITYAADSHFDLRLTAAANAVARFVDDAPFSAGPTGPPRTLAILLNRLGVDSAPDAERRAAIAEWLATNTPAPRLAEELRESGLG